MNRLLHLLFTLLFCSYCTAQQNHVPNGSFEYYVSCPTGISQVDRCIGWRQYTTGSSDYFHSCNPLMLPSNTFGFQNAAHGNAYAGCFTYIHNDTRIYKEYVAGVISPLTPGVAYSVSISASLANTSKYATNDLGVYFYDNGPWTVPQQGVLSVTPQVSFSSYGTIKDTANWVRLKGIFVADSAYDNLIIGGFKHYNNLQLDTIQSSGLANSYYLIDSVVVKKLDSFSIDAVGQFCAGDTVQFAYDVYKDFASNNVFTAQLSNASGSFSSLTNIGSVASDTTGIITCVIPTNMPTGTGYKVRLVSSSFADTSVDQGVTISIGNLAGQLTASNSGPVCSSDTLKLFAVSSLQGMQYSWSGPLSFYASSHNPEIPQPGLNASGNYIVTGFLYGCAIKDTTHVVVFDGEGSHVSASYNSPVCVGDTLKLYANVSSGTGYTYLWTGPGSFSSSQKDTTILTAATTHSGTYILSVDNGRCLAHDTLVVSVGVYPSGVTANTDTPCTGSVLHLTASSPTAGLVYSWSGPNMFTSTSATPSIAGASSVHNGDYYVAATLNGCSLKDTVTVAVKPLPAKPVANADVTLCSGTEINLTAVSATSGVTYSWTGPGSYTSSTQNPVLSNSTTAMSGNYIVKATFDGCSSADTAVVTVNQSPAAVILSSNSPQCAGSTLTLNATASTTGATYAWSGPSSYSATTQNASVTGTTTASSGAYVMTVTLNGCTYKDTLQATVNAIPAAPVVTATQPICVGETLQLSTNTMSGATYSWTGPNGFSSSSATPARNNITVNDAGAYQAIATVNGCTSSAGSATVSINPVPFVTIFSTPMDTICQGQSVTFLALPNNAGGTPQYNWLVNGQPASTGTVYNTTQLAQGDVVRCDMTEYTKCSMPYKDESNDIALEVLPWLAPSVSITASPNRTLKPDEYVTFTAIPVNGGANPKYQWKRNGNNIVGATGNIWSANTLNDNDKITVELISDYRCPQPATAGSNEITVRVATGVDDLSISGNLALYPNPNNGQFLLKGELSVTGAVTISVVNYLGQQVYSADATINNGELNHEVRMLSVPAGVYLLRLNSAKGATQSVRFTKY